MQNRKTTDKISIVPNLPNYSIVVIAGCAALVIVVMSKCAVLAHSGTWAHLHELTSLGALALLCVQGTTFPAVKKGGGGGGGGGIIRDSKKVHRSDCWGRKSLGETTFAIC